MKSLSVVLIGVRFVTAQSTRHMHYIMTCLSGDCVVLVTITVTTNSCTKETLMGVRFVTWVSDGCQIDGCQMGVRWHLSSPVLAGQVSGLCLHLVRRASDGCQMGVRCLLCRQKERP